MNASFRFGAKCRGRRLCGNQTEGHIFGGRPSLIGAGVRLLAAACMLATALVVQVSHAPGAGAESGVWTATGSLPTSRVNHTATVLSDGRVLVAGGQVPGATTDSAWLYDPVSGTWTSTGSMSIARYRHSATLLPNGKVLAVGGLRQADTLDDNVTDLALNMAEVYDPATGTWSTTGAMAASRYDHTETLLADGQVLVAGGELFFTPSPSAELYDPVTGNWTSAGPMRTRRVDHTAVLIDQAPCGDVCGMVLVAGGQVEPNPTRSATVATNSAELFDPATRTWSAVASFETARSDHTATRLSNGKVLLTGGTTGAPGGPATESARLFDPVSRTWSSTGALATARLAHTATHLPSGEVLVTGGRGPLASAELYNPTTGTWSPTGPMGAPRDSHTASLLRNGTVLVAGGDTTSTEFYAPLPPVVSVGNVAVHEGDSGTRTAVFTVSLSKPDAAGITVAYATSDATAIVPVDYTAKTGTLSFAPGSTSLTVKVPIAGDKLSEGNESFTLGLSSPVGASIGVGVGLGTIVDDDPLTVTGPRLAIGDVSVHEGDAGARQGAFNVSLSKASTSYVSVNYVTNISAGTASADDVTAKSGTITFSPGDTSKNIKLVISPDTLPEGDETVIVKLSGANGAAIVDTIGVGTIVDDD